ncbi:MAG: hypothetical protein HY925_13420, partial [Elusimicrobia bacterium]|nr:hypothetical protein [Elusimicrobiota bacterium]
MPSARHYWNRIVTFAGIFTSLLLAPTLVRAACTPNFTNTGGGDHCGLDWTITDGTVVAGSHTNIGNVFINAGSTVSLQAYQVSANGGFLTIIASGSITIDGVVDARGRGYGGGGGGSNSNAACAGGAGGVSGNGGNGANARLTLCGTDPAVGGTGGGGSPNGVQGSGGSGSGQPGSVATAGVGGDAGGNLGAACGAGFGGGGGGGAGQDAAGGGGGGGGSGGNSALNT